MWFDGRHWTMDGAGRWMADAWVLLGCWVWRRDSGLSDLPAAPSRGHYTRSSAPGWHLEHIQKWVLISISLADYLRSPRARPRPAFLEFWASDQWDIVD